MHTNAPHPLRAAWARSARTCVVLFALMATWPAQGFAHAELVGTEPANESTIEERPDEVAITFTENVTTPFGAVRVFAPDGSRVERGSADADGEVVTMPFRADEEGTYAVSWRVTSADGHPVRGAFVFHVGENSSEQVSREAALAASEGSRARDVAFGVARAGILLGVLVAVGGVLFSAFAAGSWRPRYLRASLGLAIASMLAAYVLDASIAAGLSLTEAVGGDVLREQAGTVYGRATLVRLGVALACLAASLVVGTARWHRPAIRYAALVPFVALAATLSLSGHAVGEDVSVLRLPLDMVHSIAAAAWLGGLVQLLWWARATPVDPAALVRWSRIALGSVVVLVATGSWAAWEEIGLSLDALLDTTYGRLVIAKVALLVLALPLANRNRVHTVPRVVAGDDDALPALRSYVRGEVASLVLVIAATAWLIQTPPAKVELQPEFVDRTVELGSGGSLQLVIDPATVGDNELHLYAFDAQQQVDDELEDLTLTAFNDERDIGPLEIELLESGPGHFTSPSATIPFAGEWRFEAGLKRGRFDEERARFSTDIAPSKE